MCCGLHRESGAGAAALCAGRGHRDPARARPAALEPGDRAHDPGIAGRTLILEEASPSVAFCLNFIALVGLASTRSLVLL